MILLEAAGMVAMAWSLPLGLYAAGRVLHRRQCTNAQAVTLNSLVITVRKQDNG